MIFVLLSLSFAAIASLWLGIRWQSCLLLKVVFYWEVGQLASKGIEYIMWGGRNPGVPKSTQGDPCDFRSEAKIKARPSQRLECGV